MSRLGLAGLLVSCLVSFLCGSASEAKAQASNPSRLGSLGARTDDPDLLSRAHALLGRQDRFLGLRLAEALAKDSPRAPLVAAALVQPAVAAGRLSLARVEAELGAAVCEPLAELSCQTGRCTSPEDAAQLAAHYTRFRGASRDAHLLEFHVSLDAARHLAGLDLPLQVGLLRASRAQVVPALRQRSPDLAERLDAELGNLLALAETSLEDAVALRLAPHRRDDGTLRWPDVLTGDVLQRAGEQPHFTLGLFLRELAVVVKSGSEARIAELFDGLARTDFFLQYGMFSLGASEPLYHRYLERFVKPRFVQELLRTNVVVAAGMALPTIAAGTFQGQSLGINLSALGLSTPATSRGLAALRWVQRVNGLRSVKLLTHLSRLSALKTVGGWVYTTAEILVVLYVSEQLQPRIRAHLEQEAAEEQLSDAVLAFYAALGRRPSEARALELAESFHDAWTQYRDFLYAPIFAEEQRLDDRLEALARRLKLISDRREALLDELPNYPALVAYGVQRAGSLQGYVDGWLLHGQRREAEAVVDATIGDYVAARRRHLASVYADGQRGQPYLEGVLHGHWHALGAQDGAPEDPYQGRFGTLAGRSRGVSRGDFAEAVGRISRNRLETYDDERRALDLALAALAGRAGSDAARAVLLELRALVTRTETLDVELGRAVRGDLVRAVDPGR